MKGFMSNHPVATGLGGAALGVGGTLGGMKAMDYLGSGGSRGLGSPDPFFEAGTYGSGAYEKHLEHMLDPYRQSTYDHNKAYLASEKRLRELEAADAAGAGGAAYRELANLRRSHAELKKQHEKYLSDLDMEQKRNAELMDRVAGRTKSVEGQRTNIWGLPKRIFRSPDEENEYFDNEVGRLRSLQSTYKLRQDLINRRREMLESGAIGRIPQGGSVPPSRDDLTQRFFANYGTVR